MANDKAEIWNNGEVLRNDERSLLERGIDSTSILYILSKCRAVTLTVARAEPLRLGEIRQDTDFLDFLHTASAALKMNLPQHTRFVCKCGRIFSSENAERREFPLRCCRSPEARFTVEMPRRDQPSQTVWRRKEVASQAGRKMVDAANQKEIDLRPKACQAGAKSRSRACQTAGKTKTRTCQMATDTNSRTCQTATITKTLTCQTATKTQSLTIQAEYIKIVHFLIHWRVGRYEDFNFDLTARGAPLGRDLKAALAEFRGERQDLKLQQLRVRRRSDGAVLVHVEGGCADESGQMVENSEVKVVVWQEIGDDQVVVTAGPLRALIGVYSK